MNDLRNFWNSGPLGKLMITGVGLLLLCTLCAVPVFILSSRVPLFAPVATPLPPATQFVIATPTPILLSTNTPEIVNTAELILTETPQIATPDTGCAFCNIECPASQEGIDFCVVNPQLVMDQPLFEATLKGYCDSKGADFCKILVWTDRQSLPSTLPLTEQQLINQVADYSQDRTTGAMCLLLLAGGEVVFQSEDCN